jgi:hypothetical protein
LNFLDVECRYGTGGGIEKVMSKLSKSHYQNGFLTGQRAAALAGIYESPRQSFDQIQRRAGTAFAASPSSSKKQTKKACFIVFEQFAVFTTTGSKLPKQALVF